MVGDTRRPRGRSARTSRTAQLAVAAAQLEAVLETVDLERETAVAEAVVTAVAATERARERAAAGRPLDSLVEEPADAD